MKINIRYFTQLFLSYIVLLMVAILGLSFLTVSVFKSYIEEQTIHSLQRQLVYIDHVLSISNTPNDLDARLNNNQSFQGYDLRLTLVKPNGSVFFDSFHDHQLLDNHYNRPEIKLARETGIGSVIRHSTTLNKPLVYVAKQSSSGNIYRLALPIHYLQDKWFKISQKIVIYTISIFGFCLFLTFVMSHWISSPLNWAIHALHQIKNQTFKPLTPKASFVKEINNVNRSLIEVSDDISKFIAKLSREKEKKDMILNKMINGLMVIDDVLTIRLMNKSAFGLFFDVLETNQKMNLKNYPGLFAYAKELMAGNDNDPMEIEHKNGRTILISGSIYTEGKAPRGIMIAQDITKLKGLESTRQKFVANVSHELKTPITFIRSMFETIITAKNKNIDISPELINKGLHHTDRLTQIIDDLLQLSKLETTGGEIEKASANLNHIVDAVIQQCEHQAKEKNINIESIGVDIKFKCNANLMIQALKNLLENAIKYSENHTKVVINGEVGINNVIITVKDEGQGIDTQHIDRLFQRFYRVDAGRSREMGGTGLGLAIVKHIAQSHRGHARVKSVLGMGSSFILDLPKD